MESWPVAGTTATPSPILDASLMQYDPDPGKRSSLKLLTIAEGVHWEIDEDPALVKRTPQ